MIENFGLTNTMGTPATLMLIFGVLLLFIACFIAASKPKRPFPIFLCVLFFVGSITLIVFCGLTANNVPIPTLPPITLAP